MAKALDTLWLAVYTTQACYSDGRVEIGLVTGKDEAAAKASAKAAMPEYFDGLIDVSPVNGQPIEVMTIKSTYDDH